MPAVLTTARAAAHSLRVMIGPDATEEPLRMPRNLDWEIPGEIQPKPGDCSFDLDQRARRRAGRAGARCRRTRLPPATLGTERAGSGVLIRQDGLVLTIGYLVTEAETIWLTSAAGGAVPGHVLGYDQETGFGLVQALGRLNIRAARTGRRHARRRRRPRDHGRRGRPPPRHRGDGSSPARNLPAIGNTCSTARSSRHRRTRFGAGRR